MTEETSKSKRGSPKTEVFGMRLDPKMKYLAEIAARKQRRSLANFVEWAIDQALRNVNLHEPQEGANNSHCSVAGSGGYLWSMEEADRLINLATAFPELLTYMEQAIWQIIGEHTTKNADRGRAIGFKHEGKHGLEVVHVDAVRHCWGRIKAYASGTGTKEELDEVLLQYHNETL
jgi:hypothetical protein